VTIERCSISGNALEGALVADGASAVIRDSLFARNAGHGIMVRDGRAVLQKNRFDRNEKGDLQSSDMADVLG
jgi:hypothetical protein